MSKLFKTLLATTAMAGTLTVSSMVLAADTEMHNPHMAAVWAGIGLKKDVFAAYVGGVLALNGNLGADGFLLKAALVYVDYEFNSALSPSGEADGSLYRGNVLLGYQLVMDQFTAALYAGVDVQDRDIDPGVADDGTLEDEAGFMLGGRIATNGATQFPMELEGSYSTVNNSYWSRARIGYSWDAFTIGPEGAAIGKDAHTELRIGGFGKYKVSDNVFIGVSAGYSEQVERLGSNQGAGDSVYGDASVVFLY